MDLYKKYLKYKTKYFDIKEQFGGNPENLKTPLRFFKDGIEEDYNTFQSPQDFVFDIIVAQNDYKEEDEVDVTLPVTTPFKKTLVTPGRSPAKKRAHRMSLGPVPKLSFSDVGEEQEEKPIKVPKEKANGQIYELTLNDGENITIFVPYETHKPEYIAKVSDTAKQFNDNKPSRKELFKQLSYFNEELSTSRIVGINEFIGDYNELETKNGGSWSRTSSWTNEKVATMNASGQINFLWSPETYEEEDNIKQLFYDKINRDYKSNPSIILLKQFPKNIQQKLLFENLRDDDKKGMYIIPGSQTKAYNKIIYIGIFGVDDHETKRPIKEEIKEKYKKIPCVVCGSKSNLVCDHKNDLYNDLRVLDTTTQLESDFQSLCNHCNLVKRSICKETRKTGKRYSGLNIPSIEKFNIKFTEGNEDFIEYLDEEKKVPNIKAMVGTYWYDPLAFIQFIVDNKLRN